MRLVRFEGADTKESVWINPDHIILVAAVRDRESRAPVLGRTALKMFDGVITVNGTPEEVALTIYRPVSYASYEESNNAKSTRGSSEEGVREGQEEGQAEGR